MILKTDFLALIMVTIVTAFLLWETRRIKSPVYVVAKIISAMIIVLWLMAALLYSQQ